MSSEGAESEQSTGRTEVDMTKGDRGDKRVDNKFRYECLFAVAKFLLAWWGARDAKAKGKKSIVPLLCGCSGIRSMILCLLYVISP